MEEPKQALKFFGDSFMNLKHFISVLYLYVQIENANKKSSPWLICQQDCFKTAELLWAKSLGDLGHVPKRKWPELVKRMKVIFNHLGKILQIMSFFNISINFSGNNNWSWFKESGFYCADVAGFIQFDADLGKNFFALWQSCSLWVGVILVHPVGESLKMLL